MAPEGIAPDGPEKGLDSGRLGPSFHGRLLVRSSEKRALRPSRRALSALADRWGRLARIVGQGATFLGGAAVGGGVVMFRGDESALLRPGLMIAVGIVFVLFALAAEFLAREASRRSATLARR